MTSLVSLAAVILVVTAAKQTMTLKQKTISFSFLFLWTFALECGPSSFYRLDCELSLSGMILRSPASFTWNNSKGETVCLVVKLTAAIVPTRMNILTMAIKKQLQNVRLISILSNKNYLNSFY